MAVYDPGFTTAGSVLLVQPGEGRPLELLLHRLVVVRAGQGVHQPSVLESGLLLQFCIVVWRARTRGLLAEILG